MAAKLIVSNIVSLDGYIAGPGGNPAVLPMDQAFDAYNLERLRCAGTFVLGRKTFEMFRGFWPGVQHAAEAPPVLRDISQLNGAMPKMVVSDSFVVEPGSPWSNASALRRKDAFAEQGGQRQGSARVRQQHAVEQPAGGRTVDELHLMIGNVVLGGGEAAFAAAVPQALTLVAERRFAGSQNVLLQYACAGSV